MRGNGCACADQGSQLHRYLGRRRATADQRPQ